MLFRPRGVQTNDPKYASAARVISIDEMLAYRDTWTEKLTPDFNLLSILAEARVEKKPAEPVKLVTTENGYKVKDQTEISDADKTIRSVQNILNKVTDSNFDQLLREVLSMELTDEYVVSQVVSRIFDKALEETTFCKLYALLCWNLHDYSNKNGPDCNVAGSRVRYSIITKAQRTFELMSHLEARDDDEVNRIRKRKLANMNFIAELYNLRMLNDKTIGSILNTTFCDENFMPKVPSEIDAEVGLRLLEVSGEAISMHQGLEGIFGAVESLVREKKFSTRLGFLYQNLLDLRANGWVKREDPLLVAAQEAQAQQRAAAAAAAEAAAAAAVAAREQQLSLSRAASAADLAQMDPSEQKLIALARPPESLGDVTDKARSILRDALSDGNWEQAKTELSALSSVESDHICRQAGLAAVVQYLCCLSDVENRNSLATALANPIWDSAELSRGVAWATTQCIALRVVEDVPKLYERLAQLLVQQLASRVTFLSVVKDIFARTANYLDALYVVQDGSPDWDMDYVSVWELYLKAAMASKTKTIAPTGDVLDALGSVRQTIFMKNIVPDFVGAMLAEKLCTVEDLQAWCQKQAAKPGKVNELASELAEMFP